MKKLFTTFIILSAGFAAHAQTNIGINNTNPDASAALMVDTATTGGPKGILIPRMILARRNAIISPATGLLIYQTDGTTGFYYNTGTPAAPNWQLMGAAGATGQGFVNGTGSTQVYVTGSASPYAPANPVSIVGDILLAANGMVTITNNAITNGKVADGAITTSKVVDGNITTAKIADASVNSNKIADGAIVTSKIIDAAITTNKIVDAAVTSVKIADGAVNTSDLASSSVTLAKINASGTPSSSTFLRGDGSWAAPSASVPSFFATAVLSSTNLGGSGTYYLGFATGSNTTESDNHRLLLTPATTVKFTVVANGALTSPYTFSLRRGTSSGGSFVYTDLSSNTVTLTGATPQTITVTNLSLSAGETIGIKLVGTATYMSQGKTIYYSLTAL